MLNSYDMLAAGKELKRIRTQLKLSQLSVSKTAEISIDTIRRIENGLVVPRYDTLIILSSIYRCDTLKILNSHSTHKTLIDCYQDIDEAMISHDLDDMKLKCTEFQLLLALAKEYGDIVYMEELEQIVIFYEAVFAFYSSGDSLIIISKLVQGLNIKHPDFNIQNYKNHPYSFIDLRLLILYALCLCDHDLLLSTEVLIFVFDSLVDNGYENDQLKIKLKVIYNISYNYYKLKRDAESEHFADIGIKMAQKNHMLYSLPFLLVRKGISRFYNKEPDYMKYLYQAISASIIENNHELTDHLVNGLIKKHNITLDPNFLELLEIQNL